MLHSLLHEQSLLRFLHRSVRFSPSLNLDSGFVPFLPPRIDCCCANANCFDFNRMRLCTGLALLTFWFTCYSLKFVGVAAVEALFEGRCCGIERIGTVLDMVESRFSSMQSEDGFITKSSPSNAALFHTWPCVEWRMLLLYDSVLSLVVVDWIRIREEWWFEGAKIALMVAVVMEDCGGYGSECWWWWWFVVV